MTRKAAVQSGSKNDQLNDGSITDFIDQNQVDAPYVAPGVLIDSPLVADLTNSVTSLWPGNPPIRIGSFYFDLNRLDVAAGEPGLLGNLCENFVFERVDLHLLSVPDADWSFDIELSDTRFLAGFHGDGLDNEVICHGMSCEGHIHINTVLPGTLLSNKRVYLRPDSPVPTNGRMLLSFIGYLIEPWR